MSGTDSRWRAWIADSYRALLQSDLTSDGDLDAAPRAILCHRAGPDPLFVYANRFAQQLWERPWQGFVGRPSRMTAPPEARSQRAAALSDNRVATGYTGERVSATGRRFLIRDATIWPVSDDSGQVVGQAATFTRWDPLRRDLLEILATSPEAVRTAVERGADRIELCVDYDAGGLTPPVGLIGSAVAATGESGVGVMVMIRPRGGDFVYSSSELLTMQRSIETAVDNGAAGLVLGCLTQDGRVDRSQIRRLLAVAPGVPVTFHRAVDVSREPVAAALAAFDLGCTRVLTSGGAPTAPQGARVIADMVAACPTGCVVMAGAGVRRSNAQQVRQATGVSEVHASSAYFMQ